MLPEKIMIAYKKRLCKIASFFDIFCKKHSLRYFAIGGTAIGALRHGGFIPWDDDMDFVMPRPDYESFLNLMEKEKNTSYEVFTHRNNPQYHLSMAKLCDANTSLVDDFSVHLVMGAFIDIFPMDGLPFGNKDEQEVYFNEYLKLRHDAEAINHHYTFRGVLSSVYHKDYSSLRRQFLSHWYHMRKKKNDLFEKCDKKLKRYPFDSSEYVAYFSTWIGPKVISPHKWFEGFYYVPFENIQLRLPIGIDQYLTQVYGDYMTPPPPEKRIAQHSFNFLDLSRRVSFEYAKEHKGLCKL